MVEFDITRIEDAGLRTDFAHVAKRAGNIAGSLHAAYGAGRRPIAFRYVDGAEFNAFADADPERFRIEMNAAVPLLSILLFHKLLMDEAVLPHVAPAAHKASRFDLAFIVDPADFGRRADWRIEIDALRGFAAGTIADLCSTFVLCHEFGHVLAGHVEGSIHHFGAARVAELVARDLEVGRLSELRQAWEYEADELAAVLVMNFVEELAEVSLHQPRTRDVFSDGDGLHFEGVLAVAVASLFAFFTYVHGMRLKLDRASSHPHPHVRATYLKHMLLQAARGRRDVDIEAFHARLDLRLDEMMRALARIEILKPALYSRRFIRGVDGELDRLEALRERHCDSCAPWRWI